MACGGCWVRAAPAVDSPTRRAEIASPSQVTLDLQNSAEKFGGFLRSALDVLAQILELATLQDIGKVRCMSLLLAGPQLPHCRPLAGCLGWAWHGGGFCAQRLALSCAGPGWWASSEPVSVVPCRL